MLLENFIWELKKEIESERMSHAYILAGGTGESAIEAGKFMFQYLVDNKNAFIGDYREYLDDGEEIKKENVAEIIRLAYQSSQGVGNFFLIENVERMNTTAFNVFLKTLEEPPGKTTFVLTTKYLDLVPDTILSRCRIIKVANSSLVSVEEFVMSKFPFADKELVREVVAFNNGSEKKILSMMEDEKLLNQFQEMKIFAKKLLEKNNIAERISFVQKIKADGQSVELLNVMVFVFRNYLLDIASGSLNSVVSPLKLSMLINAVLNAKKDLARNVNESLVLDNLVLLFD